MSVTLAMLICIHWRIYFQWHVANIEVGTQQANGADCRPQYTPTCLESSDYRKAGRPGECKNITLMPFLADILTLK